MTPTRRGAGSSSTTWAAVERSPGVEAGLASYRRSARRDHAPDHHARQLRPLRRRDGRARRRLRSPASRTRAISSGGQTGRNSRYGNPPDPELAGRMETLERLGLLELVDGDRQYRARRDDDPRAGRVARSRARACRVRGRALLRARRPAASSERGGAPRLDADRPRPRGDARLARPIPRCCGTPARDTRLLPRHLPALGSHRT